MARNDGLTAKGIRPSPGGLRSRLQTGVVWNLIGAVFNQGSTLAVSIIVARLLGRDTFGEYVMVLSTLLTISVMAQLYVGPTATKYLAEFNSTDKNKTGRICGLLSIMSGAMACIAGAGLLASSNFIAAHIFNAAHLATTLRVGVGLLIFNTFSSYLIGALAGLEEYRSLAKAGFISGFLYLIICVALSWWWGLNGAVAGVAASSLVQCLILHRYLRMELANRNIVVRYKSLRRERGILLSFSLPSAAGSLLVAPSVWLASAFLVRSPSGYTQMALFNAALNFKTLVMFLPTNVSNVSMSLLNSYKGQRDERRYRKAFWANICICGGTTLLIGGLMLVLGPLLLEAYGESFRAAFPVLCVLMLSAFISSLVISAYLGVQSHEKMWLSLIAITLPLCLTIIVLARFLTPTYGAVGLAAAYVAGDLVNFIMTSIFISRIGVTTDNNAHGILGPRTRGVFLTSPNALEEESNA